MMLREAALPEGRCGQLLAAGAPLCMILLIILGILCPAWRWYEGRQLLLARGQAQIAGILARERLLPQMQGQADTAQTAGEAQLLLAGASDALATANLETDIAGLATSAGASLTSTEALPASGSGGLRQVGISVRVTADWPALCALLLAIESAAPRMRVDDLIIDSANAFGPPGSLLRASFSVTAYRAPATP